MRMVIQAEENLVITLRNNDEIWEEECVRMDEMREEERVLMAQNAIIFLSDDEPYLGRREIPITSDPFIHNLKHKPNMVHDLSRQLKIPFKKQR